MITKFHNIELECGEDTFRPTLISEECALNVDFANKKILDLGCGIGPLAIYFAKNGAKEVDACDIYQKHLDLTKLNAKKNNVSINVFKSDLFDNVTANYDLICCDVSGVSKTVAEITGWFPGEVPKADETGSNLIKQVISRSSDYISENGSLVICTTSFSNIDEIESTIESYFSKKSEKVLTKEVPFSKRLIQNFEVLDENMYLEKDGKYFWTFTMYKMNK
jgi:methylase of polypeptide subunit release factors